ncbi:MAG: transcriptional regulator [Rhodobacteraceae bacterium]|nr:transcriptional regulator [Paracoccaceae bacterium]MBT26746.1 transcriptional regulator [Paracoccaceae bacterium]
MTNQVRALRRDKGWTQADLAAACGVSRQTIVAIEKRRYDPSLSLAFQIARAFAVRVEDVFHPEPPDGTNP